MNHYLNRGGGRGGGRGLTKIKSPSIILKAMPTWITNHHTSLSIRAVVNVHEAESMPCLALPSQDVRDSVATTFVVRVLVQMSLTLCRNT